MLGFTTTQLGIIGHDAGHMAVFRKERYKTIQDRGSKPGTRLFDLETDPGEKNDLSQTTAELIHYAIQHGLSAA